jgi:hypothetical protein
MRHRRGTIIVHPRWDILIRLSSFVPSKAEFGISLREQ